MSAKGRSQKRCRAKHSANGSWPVFTTPHSARKISLTDWLNWMGLVESGAKSRLDRFIGYYEPYATSHATLDRDEDMQKEGVNVAEAVAICVEEIRKGRKEPDDSLEPVRAK
jgi:hypothetical protein